MDGRTLLRNFAASLLVLALAGGAYAWQEEDGDDTPTLPETEVEADPTDTSDDDFDPTDVNGDVTSILENSVFQASPATGYLAEDSTTGSIIAVPDLSLPASVDVITRPTIDDQQILNVEDMLRNVAGAVQTGDEGQFSDGFFLRGMAVRPTDYRKNGFFDPTYTPRDFANINRVEILKGPASTLYGSGNPSGTVNVITDKPMNCTFTNFDFQPGSFGQNRYQLDTNGLANQSGTVLYRFNAAYEDADSYRDFGYLERQIFAPAVSWMPSDCTIITWEAEYVENDRRSDLGFPAVNGDPLFLPSSRFVGEPSTDFAHNRDFRTSIVLQHDFCNGWALWAGAQTLSYELPQVSTGALLGVGGPFFVREQGRIEDEAESSSLIVNLTNDTCIAGMRHRTLFGTEQIYFDESSSFSRSALVDFSGPPTPAIFDVTNPVYNNPAVFPVPFFAGATPVFRYARSGFYMQDMIDVNEHWTLLGGVRFDTINFEAERSLTTPPFGVLPQVNQTFDNVAPRAGIVYHAIPDQLSLYANYSQSFTPPTGEALLFATPGVALLKETGEAFEVGTKVRLWDPLILHVAGFHVTRNNTPFLDPNAVNFPFFYQVGEQRSQGAEVELIGQVTDRLSVIGNYAYVDTKLTDPLFPTVFYGQRQRNVPLNSASLWGRYNLIDDCCHTLGVGTGLVWVGERTADLAATLDLPAYTRLDAGVFYNRNCWEATCYFENVTDIDYATGSINTLRIFPGAPFNVRGMVGVRF